MADYTFIEGLESRVLMSVTPAPMLFNATVKADRLAVRADLLKFRSDIAGCQSKLLRDLIAIKKNTAKGDTSLVAPFQQLRTDVKAMQRQLRIDRLTEAANALAVESTIKLDIVQIIKDRGNATAEATDHAKLLSDRVALQNALIAGLDSRIATRQSFESTIAADTQAIVTAAQGDPNATTALQAAAATFAADRTACLNTLAADLQAVAAARTTLVNDLTAAQST
jgi:hypothetical protein